MGLSKNDYFAIDELAERWERNPLYVEYLLTLKMANGERILAVKYKDSPLPPAQNRVRRLLSHAFPLDEAPHSEIIIMRKEVERFEKTPIHNTKARDNFDDSIEIARELSREDQSDAVLKLFKENIYNCYCSSAEIFQGVYKDPTGAEYWQGWFDKRYLTVDKFARLSATHRAVECGDKCNNDTPHPTEKYSTNRDDINLRILLGAEEKDLNFWGDTDALLINKENRDKIIDRRTREGRIYDDGEINSLDKVKCLPREILKWFAGNRERARLLPESLLDWWATQATTKNIVEVVQEIEPQKKADEITSENYFYREGNGWRIGFQGEKATFKDYKYIHYIAYLLEKKGKSIGAINLVRAADNNTEDIDSLSEGQAFEEGLSVGRPYKDAEISNKRISEIERLLADIECETDPLVKAESQEEYEREIEKLKGMNSLVDKNGDNAHQPKRQRLDNPQIKNAQKSIKKGLDTAYSAFKKVNLKKLAKHLRENIKPDGYYDFSYRDVDISWDIKL